MSAEGSETGGDEPTDGDKLELLRRESREVLNHQISLVRSIDEKAMWVVRTAVVATSVVVTGAGIAGERFVVRNWAATAFATLGIATLLVVSVWGSILFAVSRPPFGPTPTLTDQLSSGDLDGQTTRRILLQGYCEWIGEATEEVLLVVGALLDVGQRVLGVSGAVGTFGLLLSLWTANVRVTP